MLKTEILTPIVKLQERVIFKLFVLMGQDFLLGHLDTFIGMLLVVMCFLFIIMLVVQLLLLPKLMVDYFYFFFFFFHILFNFNFVIALKSLYYSTKGRHWKNNDNWLSGSTGCDWFGVHCENNVVTQVFVFSFLFFSLFFSFLFFSFLLFSFCFVIILRIKNLIFFV